MSTETVTTDRPPSQWEQFEQAGRTRADDAGEPVERLAGPGVLYPMVTKPADPAEVAAFLLVTGRPGRLQVRNLTEGTGAVDLDLEELWQSWAPQSQELQNGKDLLRTMGGVLVVADRATAGALMRAASRSHNPLHRALSLVDSLAASSRFVVLAEALDRKFFMPSGRDRENLTDWAIAFGLPSPRSARNIPVLLNRAYSGYGHQADVLTTRPGFQPDVARAAVRSESFLVQYAAGASLTVDCSRYASMESIDATWTYLRDADPIDRERARMSGTVFTLVAAGDGLLRAEGAFNVRAGKTIVALPAGRPPTVPHRSGASVFVEDVQVNGTGDVVMRVLHSAESQMLMDSHPMMDFIARPFLPGGSPARALRWVEREEHSAHKALPRQVPLGVSIAGAQAGDEAA